MAFRSRIAIIIYFWFKYAIKNSAIISPHSWYSVIRLKNISSIFGTGCELVRQSYPNLCTFCCFLLFFFFAKIYVPSIVVVAYSGYPSSLKFGPNLLLFFFFFGFFLVHNRVLDFLEPRIVDLPPANVCFMDSRLRNRANKTILRL